MQSPAVAQKRTAPGGNGSGSGNTKVAETKLATIATDANGALHVHQHHHAPPPLTATAASECMDGAAFDQIARRMRKVGYPVTSTKAGLVVLRVDLERFLRERPARSAAQPIPDDDDALDLEAAARASGLKLVGGSR